jgi:divalent metal cation (Fe/Co/Zn/Cd) transporter
MYETNQKRENKGMMLIHLSAFVACFMVSYIAISVVFFNSTALSAYIFLSMCAVSYALMIYGLILISKADTKKDIFDIDKE